MYYLSICCIAKNETPYLEEWVNFHRAVGVEHFFIYDNESDIPISETLNKYIKNGIVTVKYFPGKGKQFDAYNDCLNNFGNKSKWISFIDCDEFILPKSADNVPDILKNYESFGGLGVSWILFGASENRSGLVIEDCVNGSDSSFFENRHIKSIVQPEKTIKAGSDPHHFVYKPKFGCVSEKFNNIKGPFAPSSTDIIQLNHYFIKSFKEFETKVNRGRADVPDNRNPRSINDFNLFNDHCNTKDYSIHKFVYKTKSLYI